MQRKATAVAVSVVAAVSALIVSPQAANASSHRPCTIVKHGTTAGVTKVGTATATLGADGIKLTTAQSTNADKVSWQTNFLLPVPAGSVDELSYQTVKLDTTAGDNTVVNDAALPSYQIFVKTPK